MRRLLPVLYLQCALQAVSAQAKPLQAQQDGAAAGRTTATVVGEVGQRQTRTSIPNAVLTERINSRIQNRIQNRVRNRIDRNYDPRANAAQLFEAAEQQAQNAGNAGRPRRP